jgi:uncharacterized protein (TIGR02147 family)
MDDEFFDSLDYRELLKEIIEAKKQLNSFFSYRWISKKAGISSTGFLSLVLKGKRNISNDLALRLCDALKFPKKETSIFLHLLSTTSVEP